MHKAVAVVVALLLCVGTYLQGCRAQSNFSVDQLLPLANTCGMNGLQAIIVSCLLGASALLRPIWPRAMHKHASYRGFSGVDLTPAHSSCPMGL